MTELADTVMAEIRCAGYRLLCMNASRRIRSGQWSDLNSLALGSGPTDCRGHTACLHAVIAYLLCLLAGRPPVAKYLDSGPTESRGHHACTLLSPIFCVCLLAGWPPVVQCLDSGLTESRCQVAGHLHARPAPAAAVPCAGESAGARGG